MPRWFNSMSILKLWEDIIKLTTTRLYKETFDATRNVPIVLQVYRQSLDMEIKRNI